MAILTSGHVLLLCMCAAGVLLNIMLLQTFHAESRTYWFNHWSSAHALPEGDGEQSLTDYRLLGVVLGLAIYNNVLLDFPLPIALYRKICGHEVGLSDLEDFQPTIGKFVPSTSPIFLVACQHIT